MTLCCCSGRRRFYRDADRAVLGGVCAGLAKHFGFNLKVTRILAVVAFFVAMPVTVIGYLAAVFLIPSTSDPEYLEFEQARRREETRPSPTVDEVRRRAAELDARLARLEKYVTSSRFELDEEFRRL